MKILQGGKYGESVKTDPQKNSGLTRQELRELESKEKTDAQTN